MGKVIATYSPCCKIFHAGDAKEGVMHCALPHDRAAVRLVDVAELDRAAKRIAELEALVAELERAGEKIRVPMRECDDVPRYIRKIKRAHQETANSTLRFGPPDQEPDLERPS